MIRGSNPDYWIQVSSPTQGINIIADMSDDFAYALSSHYDSPNGIASEAFGAIGNEIAQAASYDILFKAFTKRTWRGTSPVGFSLHLLFDALTNSKQDVHDKCNLLASLVLPGELSTAGQSVKLGDKTLDLSGVGSYFLSPPNTSRLGGTRQLDIRIGRQYFWQDMIVESAHLMSEERLDATGYPLAGGIDLTITSDYIYTKADLAVAAGLGGNAIPGTGGLSAVQQLRGAMGGN